MYNLAARGIEENGSPRSRRRRSLGDEVLAACEAVWARLRGPTPSYNR